MGRTGTVCYPRGTMLPAARVRFFALTLLSGVLGTLFVASTAHAQFVPRQESVPAGGEQYHVEVSGGYWRPATTISVLSEEFGIPGTTIDFGKDLGLTDGMFPEFRATLRPARKHKFRAELIPLKYEQSVTISRDLVFQGIKYRVGVPVASTIDWKAYRFSYEYDVVAMNRGFFGVVLDTKYSDITTTLTSPIDKTSLHAQGPVPAIGAIARVYPLEAVSLTAEFTGIKLPSAVKDYRAHYADLDVYGTLNLARYFGIQAGFRRIDVGYSLLDNAIATDTGALVMQGLYARAVARF